MIPEAMNALKSQFESHSTKAPSEIAWTDPIPEALRDDFQGLLEVQLAIVAAGIAAPEDALTAMYLIGVEVGKATSE